MRTLLLLALVAFLGYLLITQPAETANLVVEASRAVADALRSLLEWLTGQLNEG